MRKVILAGLVLMLAGCAQMQNVTVEQIRNDGHKRKEGEIALSIAQIQQSLYDYSIKCKSFGPLLVNPSNPSKATYSAFMPGLTDVSAAMVIDFEQQRTSATQYKAYTYYKTWTPQIDDIIYAASNPATCKR